jgi:indolepyruvate ferredoxin oxidoreductase alpha subunit
MCPGCGHRSAFYAIKKALDETDITVADIGCHTLGYLPPYEMGELKMCMGASTGIGSGLALFNDSRRVVAFMGDSTFFHAGIPGLINALFNQHKLTLILMENGTTAMTGHQNHPATGKNFNEPVERIPLRKVLEGLGVEHIYEVDTYQQSKLIEHVKNALEQEEVSVVIARHPCMLKFMREQRKKENFVPRQVAISQDACEQIHECVKRFGCPTFSLDENGKVRVNPDLCIGDASCLQTCPTEAIGQVNPPGE